MEFNKNKDRFVLSSQVRTPILYDVNLLEKSITIRNNLIKQKTIEIQNTETI